MTGQSRQAPGVVEVRLCGAGEDVAALAALLGAFVKHDGGVLEVLKHRGPYPNRNDPGVRVYLDVRVTGEAGESR